MVWARPSRAGALVAAVTFAVLAFFASAAQGAEPLRGQWHLDETSGNFADSSGNGLTGTRAGTVASVPDGRFGAGVHLASKPEIIDAGNQSLLQPPTVTLMAWVRSSSTPGTVENIAAQGAAGSCAHASYALYTGGSSDSSGVRFYVWNGSTSFRTPAAPNTIWNGQWHMVAGTYDGSAVRLYVDGAEVGEAPGSGSIGYGLDVSNNFTIGNYAGASTCLEDTHFPGDIDETRVYSRALSAGEIGQLAAATGPNPPELPPDASPPPPPPPGTPAVPENTALPTISALGFAGGPTGSYICNPGTWSNLPAGAQFSYRWAALEGGSAVSLATTQQFKPPSSVYGYPVTCEVTVQGPTGPVTATSNSLVFSSAGVNVLPRAYGDVRIRGIDVFQVVQPNAGARQFSWPDTGQPFGADLCGGGTPTNWHNVGGACFLQGRSAQQVDYAGVSPLDSDKPTTATVYVAKDSNGSGDPNVPVSVELSGTLDGRSLGDPLVMSATPVPGSNGWWVTQGARDNPKSGLQFKLPSAWTAPGKLRLTARVRFPNSDFGPNYGVRQCDIPSQPPPGYAAFGPGVPSCDADDTFSVDSIPFKQFTAPVFAGIELRLKSLGQKPFTRTPKDVMDAATRLYPGGERMTIPDSYRSDIDISDLQYVSIDPTNAFNCLGTGTGAFAERSFGGTMNNRSCRQQALKQVILNWINNNPTRPANGRGYDAVIAVSNYVADPSDSSLALIGYKEPGWFEGTFADGVSAGSAAAPCCHVGFELVNNQVFPLHGAAHELGHFFALPHSSNSGQCGTTNPFESWPPDNRGQLQGVRFVPKSSSIFTFLNSPVDPDIDGSPSGHVINDLMSYCFDSSNIDTSFSKPGGVWLSARNWNRVAAEMDTFAKNTAGVQQNRLLPFLDRPLLPSTFLHLFKPAGAFRKLGAATGELGIARTAASSGGYAYGPVDGDQAQIAGVVSPAPAGTKPPPTDPASSYRLRSLGAGGQVLLDAGVAVQQQSGDEPRAIGEFSGPVAAGAAAVQLVHNGNVIALRARSGAPRVRLTAPTGRTRVRTGRSLVVRWRGSDPERNALQATVDFSADNGRTWRTVSMGPSRGRVTIPSSMLSGSRRARVRVGLNDGFNQVTATSRAFLVQGNRPQVKIIAPVASSLLRAGDRILLSGVATDDLGVSLKGRSLTWYAGRRRLGAGPRLKARLSAGKVTLRLVARGSNGLTGVASVRLNVSPRRLRVVSVSVPQRVSHKATTVTVKLRTSDRAVLTAGGRRYAVRTRTTTLKVRLPKRPSAGVLKVGFRLTAASRSVKGTIKGIISVVRI
jgi:hypothetical protein